MKVVPSVAATIVHQPMGSGSLFQMPNSSSADVFPLQVGAEVHTMPLQEEQEQSAAAMRLDTLNSETAQLEETWRP